VGPTERLHSPLRTDLWTGRDRVVSRYPSGVRSASEHTWRSLPDTPARSSVLVGSRRPPAAELRWSGDAYVAVGNQPGRV